LIIDNQDLTNIYLIISFLDISRQKWIFSLIIHEFTLIPYQSDSTSTLLATRTISSTWKILHILSQFSKFSKKSISYSFSRIRCSESSRI